MPHVPWSFNSSDIHSVISQSYALANSLITCVLYVLGLRIFGGRAAKARAMLVPIELWTRNRDKGDRERDRDSSRIRGRDMGKERDKGKYTDWKRVWDRERHRRGARRDIVTGTDSKFTSKYCDLKWICGDIYALSCCYSYWSLPRTWEIGEQIFNSPSLMAVSASRSECRRDRSKVFRDDREPSTVLQ